MHSRVVAVTAIRHHRCVAIDTSNVDEVETGGDETETLPLAEGEDGVQKPVPPQSSTTYDDTFGGDTGTPPSANTQLRGHLRKRSFTSKQLADALAPMYERHGRRWRLPDVRAEVEHLDPGAKGISGAVLRRLRGQHELPVKTSTKLLQGLAVCLRRKGFGVVLHETDATGVREQALELARKRYYGEARKRKISKMSRFTRQSVAETLMSIEDTVINDYGKKEPATYVVGWTAIPPSQMDGNYKYYPPVDAIDCAGMRGRASGVAVVRGKKDADSRLHVASMSHMLAAEGDLSIGAHMAAEKAVLPVDAFNTAEYLTNFDGGASLKGQTHLYNPNASTFR